MDVKNVPAIEKLVVKLIKNTSPLHLGLKMWAEKLVSNNAASVCYIDFLTKERNDGQSVVQLLADNRYDVDPAHPELAWKEYLDKCADPVVYKHGQLPLNQQVLSKRIDKAVYHLCNGLRLFRVTGRLPAGSGGFDEDSLAGTVSQFHSDIVNALCGHL